MKLKYGLTLLVIGWCCSVAANETTVYKSIDAEGNVSFSDVPVPDAEELNVQPIQTYEARTIAPPPSKPGVDIQDPQAIVDYSSIEIKAPQSEETIWSNQGVVNVQVALKPLLQPGDTLRVSIDGEVKVQSQQSTAVQVQGIVRGEHTVSADVVDPDGHVKISSGSVTFYLQRHTIGR